MLASDPDDPWSRFVNKLREKQKQHLEAVMGGTLTSDLYHAYCARYHEIGEIIELQRSIRRGDDLVAPPKPEPFSVED